MGDTTGIAWTQRTWNPWQGCHKVSAGCKNCYMFREKRQYGQDPDVVVRSKTVFDAPRKWKDPALVFTCSWSDWFIEEADQWRDEAWEIIRSTPHLTYQILTKRIERAGDHLPPDWPLKNVWLGVSVEDQAHVDRIGRLLMLPAVVRFVSVEPLLGPVDAMKYLKLSRFEEDYKRLAAAAGGEASLPEHLHWNGKKPASIQWVIVGGESGGRARPCDVKWVRSLLEQCRACGVACFVKQLGRNIVAEDFTVPPPGCRWTEKGPLLENPHGGDPNEWPLDLRIREFPNVVTSQESAATV